MRFLLAIFAFFYGLVFGSFLNVCIYRLPRGLSVVKPRSACPDCGKPIAAYDNIPVLSWLILRGRCRDCHAPISPRYAAVELLTGLLFLFCYLAFGPSLQMVKFCVFSFLIIGLVFTDAEHKLLPDSLTLTGLGFGILFSFLVRVDNTLTLQVTRWLNIPYPSWQWPNVVDAALGAMIGASFIYGAGAIYFHARGIEGMGFGDVKLMAMIGAFLGVKLTVLTIFAASLTGTMFGLGTMFVVWMRRTERRLRRTHESAAVARKRAWQSARLIYRRYEMPFGVFLGSTAVASVFFGNRVLAWYLSFYR